MPERTERLEQALRAAETGLGSLLWVMNNHHNWADPKWDGLAAAAQQDAREALENVRDALNASPSATEEGQP